MNPNVSCILISGQIYLHELTPYLGLTMVAEQWILKSQEVRSEIARKVFDTVEENSKNRKQNFLTGMGQFGQGAKLSIDI